MALSHPSTQLRIIDRPPIILGPCSFSMAPPFSDRRFGSSHAAGIQDPVRIFFVQLLALDLKSPQPHHLTAYYFGWNTSRSGPCLNVHEYSLFIRRNVTRYDGRLPSSSRGADRILIITEETTSYNPPPPCHSMHRPCPVVCEHILASEYKGFWVMRCK